MAKSLPGQSEKWRTAVQKKKSFYNRAAKKNRTFSRLFGFEDRNTGPNFQEPKGLFSRALTGCFAFDIPLNIRDCVVISPNNCVRRLPKLINRCDSKGNLEVFVFGSRTAPICALCHHSLCTHIATVTRNQFLHFCPKSVPVSPPYPQLLMILHAGTLNRYEVS